MSGNEGGYEIEVRVRYAECDMQGHVFNAHYLMWFDMAHTAALGLATGRPYAELVAAGIDVVVAEAGVQYLAPAHFDDLLRIHVAFEPPTASSLTSRFTVRRGEDTVATGCLRHVCVDSRTLAKRPWPDDLRDALERGSTVNRPGR